MWLACLALAPFSNELSWETGNFFCSGNPQGSLQLALSLSFPFGHPYLACTVRCLALGLLYPPGIFLPVWVNVALTSWLSKLNAV